MNKYICYIILFFCMAGNAQQINRDNEAIKPVWGYRFTIEGDFDGDGKKENLTEYFVSGVDHKETNKFYNNLSYEELVDLTLKKKVYSFVLSDNKQIDTLQISSGSQQFGLSYLKNEGDLNGDGTDEVSFVVNWADWSSLNTWHIVTYRNGKWEPLYSFPIWDWLLPDLPETSNSYGLLGLTDKKIAPANDTLNIQTEENLRLFRGLVKKIETNKIQIIYQTDEAELDSMIIDLQLP